jgi:hypothetical protein
MRPQVRLRGQVFLLPVTRARMPLRRAAVLGGSAEIFWSGKYFLDLL